MNVRRSSADFVDLKKHIMGVPRVELWYSMRKSGVAEKCMKLQQLGGNPGSSG